MEAVVRTLGKLRSVSRYAATAHPLLRMYSRSALTDGRDTHSYGITSATKREGLVDARASKKKYCQALANPESLTPFLRSSPSITESRHDRGKSWFLT